MAGWFDQFRHDGSHTYYDTYRSAPVVDLTQITIGCAGCVLAVSLVISLMGSRGKETLSTFLRLVFNVHTGISILLCLTGKQWASSAVTSHCHYSPMASHEDLYAEVGLHIGLKSINITLISASNASSDVGDIYYNEQFSFNAVQDMEEEVHEARIRGLPTTIVYVLDYFGSDAGGLRWNRSFREAGHFAYIILWTAFVTWITGSVMLSFVVSYGAALLSLCGAMMLTTCVLYHALQPPALLTVPFPDGYMRLHYDWSFWLCIASGVVTFLYGISVVSFNVLQPALAAEIFLVDSSTIGDDPEEYRIQRHTAAAMGTLKIPTPYQERRRSSIIHVITPEKESVVDSKPMRRRESLQYIFDNPGFVAEVKPGPRSKARRASSHFAQRESLGEDSANLTPRTLKKSLSAILEGMDSGSEPESSGSDSDFPVDAVVRTEELNAVAPPCGDGEKGGVVGGDGGGVAGRGLAARDGAKANGPKAGGIGLAAMRDSHKFTTIDEEAGNVFVETPAMQLDEVVEIDSLSVATDYSISDRENDADDDDDVTTTTTNGADVILTAKNSDVINIDNADVDPVSDDINAIPDAVITIIDDVSDIAELSEKAPGSESCDDTTTVISMETGDSATFLPSPGESST